MVIVPFLYIKEILQALQCDLNRVHFQVSQWLAFTEKFFEWKTRRHEVVDGPLNCVLFFICVLVAYVLVPLAFSTLRHRVTATGLVTCEGPRR